MLAGHGLLKGGECFQCAAVVQDTEEARLLLAETASLGSSGLEAIGDFCDLRVQEPAAVADDRAVKVLDLFKTSAHLLAEYDPQLLVHRFQVGGVDVGGLGDGLLELFEVVAVDHIVLGQLLDTTGDVVRLFLHALVLRDDLEFGDLGPQPVHLALCESDLPAQVCDAADDAAPDRIVDRLAQLGAGRLARGEFAIAVGELPVQAEEVSEVGGGIDLRLSREGAGRLVEAVGGGAPGEEGEQNASADAVVFIPEVEQVALDQPVPRLHGDLGKVVIKVEGHGLMGLALGDVGRDTYDVGTAMRRATP